MTENLYETNQFTNHSNGTYLFQHSPSTLGAPHYGVPNINSIQSSPMSPPLNHEQLTSPGTPGHELSPMLEMPNSGGTWEYNQFVKTSSWGSSPHEELPETSRIYPFNITCQNNSSMTCKDSGSVSHAQRLDPFSKAFPTKNIELLFGDSYRTDDKHPENHISGVLHMPQSLPERSDRQTLESPVFNPMVIQGQCNQTGFHPSESQNSMHGLYQNHQQFHYGYQQQEQKLNNIEQVNRSLQNHRALGMAIKVTQHHIRWPWTNNKEGFMHTKLIWILMNLLNRQPMTTGKTSKCQSSRSSITKTNNIFVCFPNPAILTSRKITCNRSLQSKTTCLTMLVTRHPTHPCSLVPKKINLVSTSLAGEKTSAVHSTKPRAQGSVKLFHRWLWGEILFIISQHMLLSGHRYCISDFITSL